MFSLIVPNAKEQPLHLFTGFGVELEYMIVDLTTYALRSIADLVLSAADGTPADEVQCGDLDWSNELVLHVLELKTHGPANSLAGIEQWFQQDVERINTLLASRDARLMPTAAHPFAHPDQDTQLWPYAGREIYQALDQIFGCRGHGWKNLQSAHLNLPFYDDAEFAALHAAIRLVLPLIPALAAASPFLEGRDTGLLDSRLEAYCHHCAAVPLATGDIIPEPVTSQDQYQHEILAPIYRDLRARHAPDILLNEWVNARGAIARFDRNTIEIRLVDMQECPLANLAVVSALHRLVHYLIEERPASLDRGNRLESARLYGLLRQTLRQAEHTVIDDSDYLSCLGVPTRTIKAGELWYELLSRTGPLPGPQQAALNVILEQGTLATRMKRLTGTVTPMSLRTTCAHLCDCLAQGEPLEP